MPITVPDLAPFIFDPARAQQLVLSNINNFQINEPTNPFVMLTEAATVIAGASALESAAALRRMYPSLATQPHELMPHVTGNELANVFSHPSSANIVFYISVTELRAVGHYVASSKHYETYIPAGTVVNVTNIPFTLLNDIHIKLYESGGVFAEQLQSKDTASNNTLGILPSGIVNFQNGEPWIAVETVLKQLHKSTIIKTVTASEGFTLDVTHSDRYYYSDAYFKNADTQGKWAKLVTTHSDIYIDPTMPTVSILVLDKLIRKTIKIFSVYIVYFCIYD